MFICSLRTDSVSLTFVFGSPPCVPRNPGALDDRSAGGFEGIHPRGVSALRAGGFPGSPAPRGASTRRGESWTAAAPEWGEQDAGRCGEVELRVRGCQRLHRGKRLEHLPRRSGLKGVSGQPAGESGALQGADGATLNRSPLHECSTERLLWTV